MVGGIADGVITDNLGILSRQERESPLAPTQGMG
jgi:hypothetical protein